jgi:putative transposase
MSSERKEIIALVSEACVSGARQSEACECIGMSAKTLQRWCRSNNVQDGRLDAPHDPRNKLTELERQRIIKVANEPEYADLPPSKIVPKLADSGVYIASESTFYRVLKAATQLSHRQKAKPTAQRKKPRALTATGPNQIYSWDITYLPTAVKGIFLYL